MIEANAIDRIIDLTRKADGKLVDIDGVQYSTIVLHATRFIRPTPDPFTIHTLDGLVGYVNKWAEHDIDKGPIVVHVQSPSIVAIHGGLEGHFRTRSCYVKASYDDLFGPSFQFDRFTDVEPFIIGLMSLFEDTPDRAVVLKLVGNLRDEAVRTLVDDGVTQDVTVRKGIAKVEHVEVPNPVMLTPFRTFMEVAQPSSNFLLRLRRGDDGDLPTCALFEADGGRWQLEAIDRIASYLRDNITDESIPVLV